ncbi:hypothetical protein CHS0354_026060 [Potamilus streckersoni]|uniref:Uncharacterized protein n=1 Tax=Potamilus streckersoni TaxID=2493646 RepID=A0AAE0VVU0_9BIVA|nr:hypothetical protein CHS0354_026060 [Potamilus streckersoni]
MEDCIYEVTSNEEIIFPATTGENEIIYCHIMQSSTERNKDDNYGDDDDGGGGCG